MRSTEQLHGKEAREKLAIGVKKVYDAVAPTLGARGRNAVFSRWNSPVVTNDGVTIAREVLPADPYESLGAEMAKQASERTNEDAGDGPQPLHAKVLTPNGFVKIGSLKIGDAICGTDKSIQKVVGIFPKGKKRLMRVLFADGRIVECSSDHLWTVTDYTCREKTLTVEAMLEKGLKSYKNNGYFAHKFFVKNTCVDFTDSEFIIHPYTLGVLIGDGSLSGTGSIEVSLGIKKEHIIDELILPDGITKSVHFDEVKNYFRVKLNGHTKDGKSMADLLQDIGLLGSKSATKFIPKKYLYSSFSSRNALLKGLTETDGYINDKGLLEYSTISSQLHSDVVELLRGLGKSVFSYLKKRNGDSYSMTPIYSISELKGNKFGTAITEIIDTGETEEMMCIKVSGKDHLYVTDNYILTHNTTSTTILTHAIVNRGFEALDGGYNPMVLRRELDDAKNKAVEKLKELSVPAKDLIDVARISVENEEIAQLVSGVVDRVGPMGSILVEEGHTFETEADEVKGYWFERGYVSPYMITNEKGEAVLEDCAVILTDRILNLNKDLFKVMTDLVQQGKKSVLVIGDRIEGELLQTMIANKVKGILVSVAVPRPASIEELEDIAILTGATAVTKDKGISDISIGHVGMSARVIVKKDKTIIVGKDTSVLEERIVSLKEQIELSKEKYGEVERMKERLARLTGGLAVIRVGARTEAERGYWKMKIDDAVGACRAAAEEGIVAGGGATYRTLSKHVGADTPGAMILSEALMYPVQILRGNAGMEGSDLEKDYDVFTGEEVKDMVKRGIVDPAKVARCAIENAVSAATYILTTETAIVTIPDSRATLDGLKNLLS